MVREGYEADTRQRASTQKAARQRAAEDIFAAIAPRTLDDSVVVAVSLRLSPLALVALGDPGSDVEKISQRLDLVLRYYLRDVDAGRLNRPYPHGLPKTESAADHSAIQVGVDNRLWRSLQEEAERQGVEAGDLVSHAIFYFAADADSGLITERILADLEPAED